jgi:hypothetical protein
LQVLFDAYVMVDWSAAARPVTGEDSIWACAIERGNGRLRRTSLVNPATRNEARLWLAERLSGLADNGRRVLAGFDFPNAYAKGFARRAGFRPADWRGVWDGLSALVQDAADNRNNRFEVAAELNRRIGAPAMFWGHHPAHRFAGLTARRGREFDAGPLPERRLCERWVPGAKTGWQLYGNGSVGGQALTGIPVKRALRQAPELSSRTLVWPFETGFSAPELDRPGVILAEVYPSLFGVGPRRGRDAWQVENTARTIAERDRTGSLPEDFAGPAALSTKERRDIECEEGWILGAGTFEPAPCPA